MKQNRSFLIGALAALMMSCGNKGGMDLSDNEYPVRTIEAQDAASQTTYPATIKGVQDVEIRPKISGFITKICVCEGQRVNAGQLLFVIDNATYQPSVRQAAAAVSPAKAQLGTAKLTYDNSQQLFKNKVIGQYELQSAQNTYESAKASLAQAQAMLASAKETLDFCYVKSPTSGVIGSLPYKVGALVSASSPDALTTVSNTSAVEVYFSMTEKDILAMTKTDGSASAAIGRMPSVKLQLADGSLYDHPGKVVKMSGVINLSTGSTSMIARFDNPKHLLKSGSSGSIIVPYTSNGAIVVPQEAVLQVQDRYFVYVVDNNGKVKYTEVKVDPNDDGVNYVITAGLKVGDRFVVKGTSSLTDGMAIKPLTEAQYAEKLKKTAQMGADQSDLNKLKKDFGK